MDYLLQLLFSGVASGCIYALVALGMVLIFKSSKVLNIAQGHIVMLGGYFAWTCLAVWHLPLQLTIVVILAGAIILGLMIERAVIRPLIGQATATLLLVTIALCSVLQGIATLAWSGQFLAYPRLFATESVTLGSLSISTEYLVAVILAVVIMVGFVLLFQYSKVGLGMRAAAEDQQVVQSLGVKVTTVYSLAWLFACMVGMIGGFLLCSIAGGVSIGLSHAALAVVAVLILGGLNSVGGVILAGIILGVAGNLGMGYIDPILPTGAGVAGIIPWVTVLIVLLIRPQGLFGLKTIERV